MSPSPSSCSPLVVYAGAFINPVAFGEVEFINHGICMVEQSNGRIKSMERYENVIEFEKALLGINSCNSFEQVIRIDCEQFFIPGFIDMHTHAPQYRNLGLGLDYSLLEWLNRITFPEEASFSKRLDESYDDYESRIIGIYGPMVEHYLKCGTTTCSYFGSLQVEANKILVDQVIKHGQRALIGKTCMDCNSPPDYVETSEESIENTKAMIDYIIKKDQPNMMLLPVVTPRFALTCSRQSMQGLAEIAKNGKVHIQSHMSENKEEVSFARELFPECKSYAEIYESVNLLGPQTFMAHCVHINETTLDTLSKYNVSIAHCPTSNFALNSGIANVRNMIRMGIKVGLGSDVSGGYGLSILDAMRQAIISSKALQFIDPSIKSLNVKEAFYLGTLGGAFALSLENLIGNFVQGKCFDALLIDMKKCPVPRHPHESLEQSLHRLVFLGDDRWISQVHVNGRRVI